MSSTIPTRLDSSGGRNRTTTPATLKTKLRGAVSERPTVVAGSAADHASIEGFLQVAFHGPSPGEFQAQLEDPSYEPVDRLLVKQGDQIRAHLRLAWREMQFGKLPLPVAELFEVATLPEYRKQGCATALLRAAERRMMAAGTEIGMLQTDQPQFYAARGWAVCGRHSYSSAGPRDILSHLRSIDPVVEAPRLPAATQSLPLNIRLWRHVEEAALVRLYEQNTRDAFGPYVRGDAYWRWLVGRRAFDRIYVAIEGPNKFELDEALTPIVGYATTREGRIVELMTSPERTDAAAGLLARACGDAIERDFHRVRLDACPDHPLHQLVARAGGQVRHHEAENGQVHMVRVFDPRRLLQRLAPLLHERAVNSDLNLPCELGLLWNNVKLRVVINRRGAKVVEGRLGRSYITCGTSELTKLLLGHVTVTDLLQQGRVECSTAVAEQTAAVLLPRVPLWRAPWDTLPVE